MDRRRIALHLILTSFGDAGNEKEKHHTSGHQALEYSL
jgi:hypothetical protein